MLRPEGPVWHTVRTEEGTREVRESSWLELAKTAIQSPPLHPQTGQPMGFQLADQERRVRVLKILARGPRAGSLARVHADGLAVSLEDADMTTLASCVATTPWSRVCEWIMDFCHAVKAAGEGNAVAMRAAAEWPKPPEPEDVVAEAEAAAQEA